MHSVYIGIVLLSTAIAVGPAANAQDGTQDQPGYERAPVGHRQPSRADIEGDDQFDESPLAKEIDKENRLLDQELQGVCRGC
jgi:hypothetical protein